MSEEYSINLRQSGTAWVVDLAGDITIAAQGTLDQAYAAVVAAQGQTLAINFKAVDYITSNGLAIVGSVVFRARREGRRVCLVGMTPHQAKLSRMMGLANYAELFDGEEAALSDKAA